MAENVNPVVLKIKDFEPREVIFVDYKFHQATDEEGQISGLPRGGVIQVRVKAMNDGNNQLVSWMLSPSDPRDIEIAFQNTVDGKMMKTISGTGCYCIHYKECWEDNQMHYEEVTLSCQNIKNASVEFKNPWK